MAHWFMNYRAKSTDYRSKVVIVTAYTNLVNQYMTEREGNLLKPFDSRIIVLEPKDLSEAIMQDVHFVILDELDTLMAFNVLVPRAKCDDDKIRGLFALHSFPG